MNTGNLQSSPGKEIVLPPSHNVFDMNHVAEMVAFKGSDVEISNYITKLSHDEETKVADLQSQTYSKDLSDPTYHAEATD